MAKAKALILSALAGIVLFGATAPAFAGWQDEISAFDRDRMSRFSNAKAQGMSEAGNAGGFTAAVVAPPGGGVSSSELTGSWQCRTAKLGGYTPIIVYAWFRCTVRATNNGLYFEKVTGSQRISGYLDAYQNGYYILLGAQNVGQERPKPYSGANQGIGAPITHTDQVGVLSKLGPSHLKIEFPWPVYESTFDVMELRR